MKKQTGIDRRDLVGIKIVEKGGREWRKLKNNYKHNKTAKIIWASIYLQKYCEDCEWEETEKGGCLSYKAIWALTEGK
jgi:hypothetical protein